MILIFHLHLFYFFTSALQECSCTTIFFVLKAVSTNFSIGPVLLKTFVGSFSLLLSIVSIVWYTIGLLHRTSFPSGYDTDCSLTLILFFIFDLCIVGLSGCQIEKINSVIRRNGMYQTT